MQQHFSVGSKPAHKIVVVLAVMMITGCYTTPVEEARKRVDVGTPRDDAIRILSERAWYHQICPNLVGGDLNTVTDLFFFGSHNYDKADIVIVTSKPIEGIFVVNNELGSFEPYVWHAVYGKCVERDKFE